MGMDGFLTAAEGALGADWVDTADGTLARYGDNTLPGGDRRPAAVLCPGSTAEVAALVRLANEHKAPLFPTSTGRNTGLGSRSAPAAGMAVVDLGRRMNRIIEIDETLGFAAVEPGVSFRMLADELKARGGQWIASTTSGPPDGGMIGNALDKGAGYGPYFDHFGMSCGLEIVLGTGAVVRTGDGAIGGDSPANWHVSKYSFGPILDGLFAQSNFGVVTRMGVWLLPRPPAIRSFHFSFPEDDDLAEIVDLCRPLKMSNFVPTLFRIGSDLYLIGSETPSPAYAASGGRESIGDEARKALQKEYDLGAWTVSGAFYGPSMAAMEQQIQRVVDHFCASGKATYIPHEAAAEIPPLACAISSFSGEPTDTELGLLDWRPGGGNAWFLPGTPMDGRIANEFQKLGRSIYAANGLDYQVLNVAGPRFARSLHVIAFNREDADECARADATYRALAEAYFERGVAVGRAPLDWYDFHMEKLMPSFREACAAIKRALDPNGILAPGRYGLY